MMNKDKRSLCLMMALGDGCIHFTSNRTSASITITHSVEQGDYLKWKAEVLKEVFDRDVKVRVHGKNSVQVSICNKKIRAWRKFIYKHDKKDLAKIVPFIRQPELALAVWLMDDGYVEPSFAKLADGSKKNYGARFRIFTCDQTLETQQKLIEWFEKELGVKPKVHFQKDSRKGKSYPFLKMNQVDSLKLWEKIRTFVLQFKSMRNKFRHIESLYQQKLSQCAPDRNVG